MSLKLFKAEKYELEGKEKEGWQGLAQRLGRTKGMQLKMWYRSFKKKCLTFSETHFCLCIFFFLSGFYFKDTEGSQDSRGKEGTIFLFHSTTSTAHEQSDIYLQLCMSDDYHIFYITPLVFTRLPLDEIYHLIVYANFLCIALGSGKIPVRNL